MIFHYVGMPHLPLKKRYCACAFSQKIHKLTRMLLGHGHQVYVYGVGESDIEHPAFEYIPVVSLDDVRQAWGEKDERFELGYDWKTKGFVHDLSGPVTACSTKFRRNAIIEIERRKRPDHFLLLSQGYYHKPIADAVDLFLTCEPGIGYTGSYARFRAFESAFIQNFTYGSEHPRQSIDGNHYDRVIPNYFDTGDFEFGEQPEDYLLYLGRVIIRKGVGTAMKVCDHLGKRLVVAGQGSLADVHYHSDNVEFVGAVDLEERKKLLARAMATFLPTIYLEPFGGSAVESMISGTPVLTTNFGVFPETVQHGVSGFRCDTLQDFVDNTQKAFELDRREVRRWGLRYSMENVYPLFEKWWTELYRLYRSTLDPRVKAWHHVEPAAGRSDPAKPSAETVEYQAST